ncbi:hypothetical protein DFQ27_001222 [Actinomortierella ambigua]|uniref:Large ribosomal subunit protein mL59 domain-containing protein n=1 Tax=Actinomortierella ambigua TaxID=1343610 RepID=A0A9P6UD20_9FUNG|nr:hypothetical protein DFQ26_008638 [Actinomortierella ambigua]KAG0269961.1 hypothetical protein DFQ27_001222 [Actinomortierella ambigua]
MASKVATTTVASAASASTSHHFKQLLSHPATFNRSLTGLRIRPQSDYAHQWVPVKGAAPVSFTAADGSTQTRTKMRWQQAKVSARVLADLRKKAARLERAGIAMNVAQQDTGAAAAVTGVKPLEFLNLPPKVESVGKTVRMGKPDKGRVHDRKRPEREAKIVKALADMPKTIDTWKATKAAEKVKTKSTLPF